MKRHGALHHVTPSRLAIFLTLGAASLIASACFIGGGSGSKTPEATPTPPLPTAEDVISAWVRENRNVDYVGDCSKAKAGVDVGRLCSTLVGQRGRNRAYTIGPTFSEYTATLLMEEDASAGWAVLSVTNRDPNAEVPGIDWPLAPGDRVIFIGLGPDDCLSIREQPSLQGNRTICMPDGTEAIIQDDAIVGPKGLEADGFTWWHVAGDGFDGYAVDVYMRLPESIAGALATPTPAPTP
ncbi:MAG: hypothetical protein HY873_10475 [Chloroflexi bacterium]|nr:hypothetical protein [Chloroflexota bacterium]